MQPTSLQVELTVSLPATFAVVFQHKNTNTVLTNISSGEWAVAEPATTLILINKQYLTKGQV